MKTKLPFILLLLLTLNHFCYSQCKRKTRKEIKKIVESPNNLESKILDLTNILFATDSAHYKCFLPAVYYYAKYSIEQELSERQIEKKSLKSIDTLYNVNGIYNIVNKEQTPIQERVKRLCDRDSILILFKKEFLNQVAKNSNRLDSIHTLNINSANSFALCNEKAKKYLRKKFSISTDGFNMLENKIQSFFYRKKAVTDTLEIIHQKYFFLIDSLRMRDTLQMKLDYTGDMIIDSVKNLLMDLTNPKGKSSKERLPETVTAKRVGPNDEDLLIHWSMLLDTSFAFALGDYKTDIMDYQITHFILGIKEKAFGRKLDVDLSFLGVADANHIGNLKYVKKIENEINIQDEFRLGENVDAIDEKSMPRAYTIKYGKNISNNELAMLRCYNAFKITKSIMKDSKGKIRYLKRDAISFMDIDSKKGPQFRRIEITAYIYKFSLIDKNGREIPISVVQKHGWKGQNNITITVQEGKEKINE